MSIDKGVEGGPGDPGRFVRVKNFHEEFEGKSYPEIFETLFERKRNAEETLKKLKESIVTVEDCLFVTEHLIGEFLSVLHRKGIIEGPEFNTSATHVKNGVICRMSRRVNANANSCGPEIICTTEKITELC